MGGVLCGMAQPDKQFSESPHKFGKFKDFIEMKRGEFGKFKYECHCGRNLTISEQWQFATDLCPPLNTPWRQSEEWFGCTNGAQPYDADFDANWGRTILGKSVYNQPSPVQIPIEWKNLKDRNGNALGNQESHLFSITNPPTSDGEMTLKFIDTYGDGWGQGRVTSWLDVNDQTGSGLLGATRSWTRQDTFIHLRGSEEGGGHQTESGQRDCHQKWSIMNFGKRDFQSTHIDCRKQCQTKNTEFINDDDSQRCTHYSWSGRGASKEQVYANFNGEGPVAISYEDPSASFSGKQVWGSCKLYSVNYDMIVIGQHDWDLNNHMDGPNQDTSMTGAGPMGAGAYTDPDQFSGNPNMENQRTQIGQVTWEQ